MRRPRVIPDREPRRGGAWVHRIVAGLVLLVAAASPASAWEFFVKGSVLPFDGGAGSAYAVRVAADGDVIVAGGAAARLVVARVDAASGKRVWLHTRDDLFAAYVVALDSSGDVYVGSDSFAVFKLDGATGEELWSRSPVGVDCCGGSVSALVVDGSGDAVAAGRRGGDITVVRFAATDGATVWEYETEGFTNRSPIDHHVGLALDGASGVVAGGTIYNDLARDDVLLVRLALADGSETWRVESDSTPMGAPGGNDDIFVGLAMAAGEVSSIARILLPSVGDGGSLISRRAAIDGNLLWEQVREALFHPGALAVDGAGDVVAAADDDVTKFRGSDGFQLWTTIVPDPQGPVPPGSSPRFVDVTLDPDSDVLVAGESGRGTVLTARLDGTTGSVDRLESLVPYPTVLTGQGAARAVTVDPSGARVTAGAALRLEGGGGSGAFDLVLLRTAERLPGRRLELITATPAARRLVLKVKDPLILGPAPSTLDDPTVGGATLEITNPTTLETAQVSLPAAGWEFLRPSSPGKHGWRYTDKHGVLGPCSKVGVASGKGILAYCGGPGLPFTLDEPSQGQLDVKLKFSPTGTRWCLSFGGVVRDEPGRFSARDAAAPATCS